MIRKLLATLCALAFASSASAECAWVVWIQRVGPIDMTAEPPRLVVEAANRHPVLSRHRDPRGPKGK